MKGLFINILDYVDEDQFVVDILKESLRLLEKDIDRIVELEADDKCMDIRKEDIKHMVITRDAIVKTINYHSLPENQIT